MERAHLRPGTTCSNTSRDTNRPNSFPRLSHFPLGGKEITNSAVATPICCLATIPPMGSMPDGGIHVRAPVSRPMDSQWLDLMHEGHGNTEIDVGFELQAGPLGMLVDMDLRRGPETHPLPDDWAWGEEGVWNGTANPFGLDLAAPFSFEDDCSGYPDPPYASFASTIPPASYDQAADVTAMTNSVPHENPRHPQGASDPCAPLSLVAFSPDRHALDA
ncbi:hypothetical protein BT67DRAFT_299893 [Trichocladium antarcticum]|uniref:Uncharacterized protein n=1 Tax=Trichocladium antarcticum TaxID=1450529 RepID=A0AAN6ZE83_9PEZI|nr:hypothetical protein BT67DRAFT_299893 [Trichocladium antarcticum]